jgi:transcriptional regulator with XRE-family HTH domain
VGTVERPIERAKERASAATGRAGTELRAARRDRNLSLAMVGASVGITAAAVSRIERGLAPEVSVLRLAQLSEAVGLELSLRFYGGGLPVRDAAHAALLARFHQAIHPTLRWAVEVPFPRPGDQRAWDALVAGTGWRYGVEAETAPRDVQALARRLAMKLRDGNTDGILLVLPKTRRVREFLVAGQGLLDATLPVSAATARARLAAGLDPGGDAIVLI